MQRIFLISLAMLFSLFASNIASAATRALELPSLPAALAFGALSLAGFAACLSLSIAAMNR